MRLGSISLTALCFAACPPATNTTCQNIAADAGSAAPGADVSWRFVNLSRALAQVAFDGSDAGLEAVAPMNTLVRTTRFGLSVQRGTVYASAIDADGGVTNTTVPLELDARTEKEATFILKDLSPARISMNVSIERQTPKPTFGERVRASLANVELPAGVDVDGDCAADITGLTGGSLARLGLREDTELSCESTLDGYFARPAGVSEQAAPYFVRSGSELSVAWVSPPPTATVSISAALRKLYVLNVHSARLNAGLDINNVVLLPALATGVLTRVPSNLLAKAARNAGANSTARFLVDGTTQQFPLATTLAGPCRPPYLCDFMTGEDTLLVVSETGPTSVSVLKAAVQADAAVRQPVVFGTTALVESKGCVNVLPNDDICTMGAAVVKPATSSGTGGAASASYAATGRLLLPPAQVVQGTPFMLTVDELSSTTRRFVWDMPLGLTPISAARPVGGFAIVASGTSLDARYLDKRALYFVDTTVSPWRMLTSLSR